MTTRGRKNNKLKKISGAIGLLSLAMISVNSVTLAAQSLPAVSPHTAARDTTVAPNSPRAEGGADSAKSISPLTFSAYAEIYYAYTPAKPKDNNLPAFYYNYNRQNEINLNLAFAKVAYQADRVRANLALGFGNYVNANYAAETGTLKNLYEANAGIKLSAKSNFWLDAGIFSSHIGFESAVGKDSWTLTRSLVAESSPYYESGARLSYSNGNGQWYLAALVLNGWQRITRVPGNSLLSWGTQVTYKPTADLMFNYSTFIGTDSPDSVREWRYYQDFYAVMQFSALAGLTAGLDYGLQQQEKNSPRLNSWYAPVAILRLTPATRWAFAARGEYYSDRHNIIIGQNSPKGFRSFGYSLNADYKPVDNIVLRVEVKQLNSPEAIFARAASGSSRQFDVVTAAMAISF